MLKLTDKTIKTSPPIDGRLMWGGQTIKTIADLANDNLKVASGIITPKHFEKLRKFVMDYTKANESAIKHTRLDPILADNVKQ